MNPIQTIEEFQSAVAQIWLHSGYQQPYAFGIAAVSRDKDGQEADITFLSINIEENFGVAAVLLHTLYKGENEINVLVSDLEDIVKTYFHPFLNDGKTHANLDALMDAQISNEKKIIFYFDRGQIDKKILSLGEQAFKIAFLQKQNNLPRSVVNA